MYLHEHPRKKPWMSMADGVPKNFVLIKFVLLLYHLKAVFLPGCVRHSPFQDVSGIPISNQDAVQLHDLCAFHTPQPIQKLPNLLLCPLLRGMFHQTLKHLDQQCTLRLD